LSLSSQPHLQTPPHQCHCDRWLLCRTRSWGSGYIVGFHRRVKVPSVRSILYYHLMSLVIVGLTIHGWLNWGLDWDTIQNKPVGDAFGTDVSWHDVSRCVPLARHVFRLRFVFS
jgi:hypothetical protein